ncbi:major facilitator superfamily MFS_1 [Marinithermus hydrothermalis DSM 14884]|uniref:Major facilitator superfamily MFS_1 n=1 Tax=Marinithermus hydrothermalis (strain DSM 14884 / JCM 11576 / T1) TaxID=869210 RepID=F2NPW4_MARHT|nr:major facilitator superfamily MFS_1 [Marinithermus hydrothermalis DSM 14884]
MRFTLGSFLGLLMVGAIVATPGAVLSQWIAEFEVRREVGLFFNLLLAGLVAGIALASRLPGRHPLMPLALGLTAGGFLLAAQAREFAWVLAAAPALGFGNGVMNVHGNSLVGELFKHRRVLALNLVNAAFGLGAMSAPFLAAFLPWRTVFMLLAALAFVGVGLVWGAPRVTAKPTAPTGARPRGAGTLLLAVLVYTGLEGALATWSGAYLAYLGREAALAGTLLSLYWGGLTLGRVLLAPFVARAPLRALAVLMGASVLVLALILAPPLAVLFPLAGVFYGPLFGTVFALVQERFGHQLVGQMFYAGALGSTLVPAAFSLAPHPDLLPYGFLVLAVGLYGLIRLAQRQYAAAPKGTPTPPVPPPPKR